MRSLKVVTPFFLLVAVFSTLCFAAPAVAQQAPVLVTQPVDNAVRTTLAGNVHPLARAEYDQGEAPASMALHRILLVLKRSDQQEASLRRLIENQQFKNSPSYHQWLTPQEFGAQFGPADSDIAAVTNWLTASGFAVTQVSYGRTIIEFDGTAGLVKQAFGTAIHKYVIKGEEHWANSSNPSIPTALAPVVAGFNSLHDFRRKAQNVFVGRYDAKTKQLQSPKYTFNPNGNTYYGLGPFDFATIYDELPLWNAATPINGTGVTIGIVGRTDIDPTDATDFWTLFGLGQNGVPMPTITVTTNGIDPGFTGDEPEADIDTQWSGAAAPGATINFVTSASTETTDGVDLSALYIVDNNLAPVMSESYGSCEASGTGLFYGAVWEQAAAQGISAMVSTGDNGSAGCDDPNSEYYAQYGENVNGIASTPWNAAVGGTDFNQFFNPSTYWNSSNTPVTQQSVKTNTYIPETTWDDSCTNPLLQFLTGGSTNPLTNCNNPNFAIPENQGLLDIWAGSGGQSGSGLGAGFGWLKPTWQTGAGVLNDSARDLPDVSLFASGGYLTGSFYIICEKDLTGGVCDLNNFDFLGFGGTSVASPAFAGIMALVNQKWGPQGVPGLTLYNLASKQPNAFHDINTSTIQGKAVTTTNSVVCANPSTSDCNSANGDLYGILSGWATTANYDLATGLGSVDAANLVNNWNKVTFTPTTTTLTLNTATVTHGTAVPVTVSVAPAAATGDVALLVNPGTPGNPGIDGRTLTGGAAAWSTSLLPGGTYKVIAHYAGDKTYGGSYSSPSANITVIPETSSVYMPGVVVGTDTNGNPVYSTSVTYGTGAGDAYWLRADVQNSQQNFCTSPAFGEVGCPTGTVSFTDNGNPLDTGTFKLNSEGYTEDQGVQLQGGSNTLVASYSGDASYKASSSASVVITVAQAATSISNLAAPSSANPGQSFTVTATVTTSSYGAAPSGTVVFLANGTALTTGTVQYTPQSGSLSTGTVAALGASLTTSIPTAGTYTLTATYSGDGNYTNVAQSNQATIVINNVGSFTIGQIGNVTITAPGQSGTAQVTLTPTNGFTGQVSIVCTLPASMTEATCPTVNATITNANPVTAPVVINTTGPHQVAAIHAAATGFLAFGVLAGVFVFAIPGLRRRRLPLAMLLFGIIVLIVSCGGGSSGGGTHTDPGTPAGTYTVNLTATSGSISVPASFSVTVNP